MSTIGLPVSEAFPLVGPEYHRFLYAVICDESNGSQLTMASALGRRGVDPWAEAARLATLPKDAALAALTTIFGEFPCDAVATAARFHALLPVRQLPGISAIAASPRTLTMAIIVVLGLIVGLILVSTLASTPSLPGDVDHASSLTDDTPAESNQ
ncbi:MAG: hypothetical protein ACXU84_22285 [Xanthobacteraceae bacterium]